MNSYKITLLLLAVTSVASEAMAGAWPRKQGSLYSKLAFTTLSTTEAHDQNGDTYTTPQFSTWSLNLYGEYGVTDRLTAILRAPVLRSAKYGNSESVTDVGDFSVEAKYAILAGGFPVAVAVEAEFPTGDESGVVPLTDGSGGTARLPTGDGEYNTRIKALISRSFHPVPAYASFVAGYDIRTEGFTDEYLVMIQAGYRLGTVVWLQGNLHAKGPVSTPDATLASQATLGFGEGVQYIAYSLGLAYDMLPSVALSFDAYSAFGKVTSIYTGLNLVFGISYSN
jgi:hypothetical protein